MCSSFCVFLFAFFFVFFSSKIPQCSAFLGEMRDEGKEDGGS